MLLNGILKCTFCEVFSLFKKTNLPDTANADKRTPFLKHAAMTGETNKSNTFELNAINQNLDCLKGKLKMSWFYEITNGG